MRTLRKALALIISICILFATISPSVAYTLNEETVPYGAVPIDDTAARFIEKTKSVQPTRASYNSGDVAVLKALFEQTHTDGKTKIGKLMNENYNKSDPATYPGVVWENGRAVFVMLNLTDGEYIYYFNLRVHISFGALTALRGFYSYGNTVLSFDFVGCSALQEIAIPTNRYSSDSNCGGSLDAHNCTSLTHLTFTYTQADSQSINIKGCTALSMIDLTKSSLTTPVDISDQKYCLTEYYAYEVNEAVNSNISFAGYNKLIAVGVDNYAPLKNYDFSGCPNMEFLCAKGDMSSLNLTDCSQMQYMELDAYGFKNGKLDLRHMKGLHTLSIGTITNSTELTELHLAALDGSNGTIDIYAEGPDNHIRIEHIWYYNDSGEHFFCLRGSGGSYYTTDSGWTKDGIQVSDSHYFSDASQYGKKGAYRNIITMTRIEQGNLEALEQFFAITDSSGVPNGEKVCPDLEYGIAETYSSNFYFGKESVVEGIGYFRVLDMELDRKDIYGDLDISAFHDLCRLHIQCTHIKSIIGDENRYDGGNIGTEYSLSIDCFSSDVEIISIPEVLSVSAIDTHLKHLDMKTKTLYFYEPGRSREAQADFSVDVKGHGSFSMSNSADIRKITLTANPDEGETYIGWYNNGDLVSNELSYTYQYDNHTTVMPTAQSFVAKFTGNPSVIYYVDGQEYHVDEYEVGSQIVPLSIPQKDGLEFSGWSDIPATIGDDDVLVYGSFAYNINYIVDGEQFKTVSVFCGNQIPEFVPQKGDRVFAGWQDALPETMPAEHLTCRGRFYYTITYMVEEQVYQTQLVPYGQRIQPVAEPFKADDLLGVWVGLPVTMPAEDLIINAEFIPYVRTAGDANGDGYADSADAALILRSIVLLDKLSAKGARDADVDGVSGVTSADAAMILRFIVHLVGELI
ncbi:MAG: dockerin type I repeat-containing protein [Eubacteriales bacterium]|nr:dockerin type I repeat-containing protein [Eubacteriales bacterium]